MKHVDSWPPEVEKGSSPARTTFSTFGATLSTGWQSAIGRLCPAGIDPMAGCQIEGIVAAMHQFALDPTLKATVWTSEGSRITAIGIQRRYLKTARKFIGEKGAGFFPHWVKSVLDGWEEILQMLEDGSPELDTILDHRIKLALYRDFAQNNGVSWEDLPKWNPIIERLASKPAKRNGSFKALAHEVRTDSDRMVQARKEMREELKRQDLDWNDLPAILDLKPKLLELETRFLQVGGLFQSLDQSGALQHRVISDRKQIEDAVDNPPAFGRAALRGAFVKENANKSGFGASWGNACRSTGASSRLVRRPFR